MPRADLLSLSPDDLATLANRGLVKRAQSELDGEQITYTLSENAAGTVSVLWSDDVHCLLPSGAPLQNGKCSCSATGLCRHLLRSVLAYQREHSTKIEAPSTEVAAEIEIVEAPVSIWNPGEISDEALTREVPAATLTRARRTWESGQVIEVNLGARPGARFHTLGVNTRFMVPHDARYTHCDCAEAAPCIHVVLAVWAFRELAPEALQGLVSTQTAPATVPESLLDGLESALGELSVLGVAGASRPFLDKLSRLENECRALGLVWPAEIVAELSRQIELHGAHNARFEPNRVAQLAGELLMRADAIRSQTGAVPDVFVRGAASDTFTDVGAARLIGIGTQARLYRGGVELSAFLQDTDSGAVVFVSRDFPDPQIDASQALLHASGPPSSPQPLWKLAASPVIKGTGIGSLGSGQVLARGGKRGPDGEFSFGRTPLSFNLQSFEWEKLRAPLLCEGFAQIEAHFAQAAPAALRPRRAGEDVFVVPVVGVENARFYSSHQEVRAILRDASGAQVLLIQPYAARSAAGIEALLAALTSSPVRFIAGRFSRGGEGLIVAPLALIVENGASRSMIQPWVSEPLATQGEKLAQEITNRSSPPDPLRDFQMQLQDALGELWLVGLERADERVAQHWARLATHGAGVGFGRLIAPIETVSEELARKAKVRQWDSKEAQKSLFEVAILAVLGAEIG
ncbi:MAG TPA: hypothetical protein VGB45_07915 [Abditibacterium sp.]